jgi:cysteinyl-tRNA synthetase
MDEDFNTSAGLAVLFGIAKELQRERNLLVHEGSITVASNVLEQQWHTLVELAEVLGLVAQADTTDAPAGLSETEIEALIAQRAAAKSAKDFDAADRIRAELQAQGISLIDKSGGLTLWHRS